MVFCGSSGIDEGGGGGGGDKLEIGSDASVYAQGGPEVVRLQGRQGQGPGAELLGPGQERCGEGASNGAEEEGDGSGKGSGEGREGGEENDLRVCVWAQLVYVRAVFPVPSLQGLCAVRGGLGPGPLSRSAEDLLVLCFSLARSSVSLSLPPPPALAHSPSLPLSLSLSPSLSLSLSLPPSPPPSPALS